MKLNRLRVCKDASAKLSSLKAKTGLNPNILCRIGFCLSLNDPSIPKPEDYPPDSDREIDRHTLTGPWDQFFVTMIRERCKQDAIEQSDDQIAAHFRAHVNRGVLLLFKRTRTLNDLALLLPRNPVTAVTHEVD